MQKTKSAFNVKLLFEDWYKNTFIEEKTWCRKAVLYIFMLYKAFMYIQFLLYIRTNFFLGVYYCYFQEVLELQVGGTNQAWLLSRYLLLRYRRKNKKRKTTADFILRPFSSNFLAKSRGQNHECLLLSSIINSGKVVKSRTWTVFQLWLIFSALRVPERLPWPVCFSD